MIPDASSETYAFDSAVFTLSGHAYPLTPAQAIAEALFGWLP